MSGDDEKTEFMNDTLYSDDEDKEPLLASYQSSLSSSRSPSPEPQSESESESEPPDPKFTQPTVSRFKRTFLLIFFAVLCWLAFSSVLHTNRKPKVIHASRSVNVFVMDSVSDASLLKLRSQRYSKDYKFRPAASPVITETLKDGRTRLRGALPLPTQHPAPPVATKKRKPKAGKVSGRRKSSGTKSKPRAVNQQRM